MKARWMKAVLENSKEPTPVLPFHRTARKAKREEPVVEYRKSA